MENKDKYKNISSSSLVGLKSELFRKQQESKHAKANGSTVHKSASLQLKSDKLKSQEKEKVKNAKGKAKERDSAEVEEEVKTLEKSRQMLEAKAKLYDGLKCGAIITEDSRFLVDFRGKEPAGSVLKGANFPVIENAEPEPEPKISDEEWVDYTDSSGKSRKCLKMDLPYFRSKSGQPSTESAKDEKVEVKEGPIHFEDVKHNEKRTLGVGYYQFSKDEEERKKQMDLLENLRGKTLKEQVDSQKRIDKRKTALEARLAKVREKKLLQMGLPKNSLDKQIEEKKAQALEDIPLPPNQPTEDTAKDKSSTVRPWDVGKPKVDLQELLLRKKRDHIMSQDEWVSKKRTERPAEFAPCYDNFVKDKGASTSTSGHQSSSTDSVKEKRRRVSIEDLDPKSPMDIEKDIASKLAFFRAQFD